MPPVPQMPQASLRACESPKMLDTQFNESTSSQFRGSKPSHENRSKSPINLAEDGISDILSSHGGGDTQGRHSFALPRRAAFGEARRRDLRKLIVKRHYGSVDVPLRSPTPSEFGDEYSQGTSKVELLPPEVYKFLDEKGLEAYAVPGDGNCLYRAATLGPGESKHALARLATATRLGALREDSNPLDFVTDSQLNSIREVKALAELLGAEIRITKTTNLRAAPDRFSPKPNIDPHRHKRPNPVIDGVPGEARELLLYNDHYYRLFPKNRFPNLKKYVVRLKSPFEQEPDMEDEESTIALEEGPYAASKKSGQGNQAEHLKSRPINGIKGGATKEHKGTIAVDAMKCKSNSKEVSSTQDKKTVTPFRVVGSALIGFLAGAGLVTTVYGLFKGGKYLYEKLFKGKARTERRRLKRRMVDFMLEE